MNQRDDSYLRSLHQKAGGEIHQFLTLLAADKQVGMVTHDEWQDWLRTCQCTWTHDDSQTDREHFPTSRTHPCIQADCQPHQVIRACTDFLLLVDEDWRRIADWYGLEEQVRVGIGGEALTNSPPTSSGERFVTRVGNR